MKRKAIAVAAAGVVGAVAVALAPSEPKPPCVARYPGEPEQVCRRKTLGATRAVEPLVPFSASEMVGWCRPIACDAKNGGR